MASSAMSGPVIPKSVHSGLQTGIDHAEVLRSGSSEAVLPHRVMAVSPECELGTETIEEGRSPVGQVEGAHDLGPDAFQVAGSASSRRGSPQRLPSTT